MDAETLQRLYHVARLSEPGSLGASLMNDLLQTELARAAENSWKAVTPGECPLAHIGDVLVRYLTIISKLAHAVVHGKYIRDYISSLGVDLANEPDLRTTEYLDDKHAALKIIANEVEKVTSTCSYVWSRSPTAPIRRSFTAEGTRRLLLEPSVFLPMVVNSFGLGNSSAQDIILNTQQEASGSAWNNDQSAGHQQQSSDSSTLDIYGTSSSGFDAQTFIEKLKARGTGNYTCPHGVDCKKGGIDRYGSLRVFSRNCDFRQHLLRHEKLYKCNLPGCPNTKGFARKDQLDRHQKNVKHTTPVWHNQTPLGRYEYG